MPEHRWLLVFGLLLTAGCIGLVESEGERHNQAGSGGSAGSSSGATTAGAAGDGSGRGGGSSVATGTTGTGTTATGSTSSTVGSGGSATSATGGAGGSGGDSGAGGGAGSGVTDSGARDQSSPDAARDAREAAADAGPDRSVQDAGAAEVPVGGDPENGLLKGITGFHNVVRAQVGVGPLTWDPTVAATAQAYAARCVFEHSGAAGLGENLAAYAPPGGHTASSPVDDWAGEKANYDYANNSCAAGKVCGHYTQVVWRNSLRLGCGVQSCSTNSPFMGFPNWEIWVCNYAPPGNFGGQRPY